jgi:hypothetical protein
MKIIRAFWGSQEKTWEEVPNKPIFEDEVVYVYGRENYEKFRSMGCLLYTCDAADEAPHV